MTREQRTEIEAGQLALSEGRWQEARAAFEAALGADELPEAVAGIGAALWWLGDLEGAVAQLERAYAAFRKLPEPAHAAAVALRLALICAGQLLNDAAGAGWLARAARLIEEHGIELLRGELTLMRAYLTRDSAEGEALAREALALGKQAGDADLELCALCQLGAWLVEQGRAREGIALMDEAMAGCVGGETRQLESVVFACCITVVSCARCADFERAAQWVRALRRFAERYGSPYHFAECRAVHAAILLATGDFERAERALLSALQLARGIPVHEARVLALLGQLRVMQGRLEEAERFLPGLSGHSDAVPVLASIQLLRGNVALAKSILQHRLEVAGSTRLESGVLLEWLGLAELAGGEHAAARERGQTLALLGASLGCRILEARGKRLWGQGLSHQDASAARLRLDEALALFLELGMPYEVARTRYALALVLREAHPELAAIEARAACSAFSELGARSHADEAAALSRQLGLHGARSAVRVQDDLSSREQEVLGLIAEGLSNPAIGRRLYISRKTVEHHVAHILQKLGLKNRAEAAAEAIRRQRGTAAGK